MSNSYTQIVEQAVDLLETLNIQEYQKVLPPHFNSSIGAHIRHVVDHFQALIAGSNTGHVDYNVRHRQGKVEQYPSHAIEALRDVANWLENLTSTQRDETLKVTSEIDISDTKSATCYSTLERELVFVTSHAIHHYALIKIMCGMLNKSIPSLFGYAPATISHIHKSA